MAVYSREACRLVVFVRDENLARGRSISAVAGRGGAHVTFDIASVVQAATPGASVGVGLVHLAAGTAMDPGLAAIRGLAKAGVRVIAYGARLEDWPIGARCRALLAGAVALVDAADPRLAEELWIRTVAVANLEADLARDEQDVQRTFRTFGIVGRSDAMRRLFRWTMRISRLSDLHTLISGESGTGKELFAQAIHQLDPKRRQGPLVVVNCGAISPALAESELFGHRRGAFTGADRDRVGLIRASHGGVLFLDEIGEMDLALQAKLLRVLQEGRVLRVGDDHEVPVDVRVIAATNRNLEEMVAQKTFRADLFHRLAIVSMHIPPLRERRADVEPLIRYFLSKHGHETAAGEPAIGDDFMAALTHAELAGNVREVENVVRHALVRHDGGSPLTLVDLPPAIWSCVSEIDATDHVAAGIEPAAGSAYLWRMLSDNGWSLSRSLASCERELVEGALRTANGNQTRAARLLGLTPRSIYNKVRKFRLPRRSA